MEVTKIHPYDTMALFATTDSLDRDLETGNILINGKWYEITDTVPYKDAKAAKLFSKYSISLEEEACFGIEGIDYTVKEAWES